MKSNLLLTIVSALLASTFAVRAQSEGFVEARIRFISMSRPLVGVGVVSNRKPQGLVIPTDMFSEEIAYRGPARLELVQMNATRSVAEPSPQAEEKTAAEASPRQGVKSRRQSFTFTPKPGSQPLAWIELPQKQGLLHLIILVTPGKGNGMVMLPDKPGSFPMGSNRYLNLCAFPVTVKVPAGDYVIPPAGHQTLRPGALDMTYYDLQMLTKEAKVVFSSRTYHQESCRNLFILSQLGDSERVQVKAVVERPAPAKTLELVDPAKK